MSYKIVALQDKWKPRKGIEGPFFYPSGAVLYYDPKEGQYWDPSTDWYVSNEDVAQLKEQIFCKLRS